MKLWHPNLIPYLPDELLYELETYCCRMRGSKWQVLGGEDDYVFNYSLILLFKYHRKVINQIKYRSRIYYYSEWQEIEYRGYRAEEFSQQYIVGEVSKVDSALMLKSSTYLYKEHDERYLQKCIDKLKSNKTLKWKNCFIPNNYKEPLCTGKGISKYNDNEYECRRCYLYDNLIVPW